MDNALSIYMPSQNISLANALMSIEAQLERAARENLETAMAQSGDSFTEMEKRAIIVFEELKLVNGMDLAGVLLRGKLLKQIEEEGLWTIHPNTSGVNAVDTDRRLAVIAREVGCSISELSNIKDLTEVIFPYMENTLHIPVAQVWEEIGKSNFREMVPVLRSIITGEPAISANVNNAVNRILDDTAATALAAGQELGVDEVRARAVSILLEQGGQMTNRELRQTLRPERTEPINATILNNRGTRYFVAEMTDDQYTAFSRRVGALIDAQVYDVPQNADIRRRELPRNAAVRRIMQLMEN